MKEWVFGGIYNTFNTKDKFLKTLGSKLHREPK